MSPRKLFKFIIKWNVFRIKVSKTRFILFWKQKLCPQRGQFGSVIQTSQLNEYFDLVKILFV